MRSLRLHPWLRWTIAVTVVIGSMVAMWRHVDAKARRELEAAKAAFAAHGFPTRIEEILPPPVAEEDNADALLREAWAIVAGRPDWNAETKGGVFEELSMVETHTSATAAEPSHLNPEGLAELRRLALDPDLTRLAEALRVAARMPAWQPAIDTSAGPAMRLPTVGPCRHMVRFLCWRALGLAQDPSTVTTAWEDLATAQILADWIDEPPFLIMHLTSIACHGMIHETAIDILDLSAQSPALYAFLDHERTVLIGTSQNLARAAQLERLYMLPWIETQRAGEKEWFDLYSTSDKAPRWLRWSHAWLSPILGPMMRPRWFMELRDCYRINFEIELALHEGGPFVVSRLHDLAVRTETSESILAGMLVPTYEGLARTDGMNQTSRRSLVVALMAWTTRMRTGHWPESVAELGLPETTTVDICSDHPLVMRTDEHGVTVYGWGYDLDDDGGQTIDRSRRTDDGDIVVRLLLPPSDGTGKADRHAD